MVQFVQRFTRLLALLAVLCGIPLSAAAQSVTVSGTIRASDDGEPLVGATVLVKGTTRGVLTNDDGAFSLEVPDLNTSLVVSYLGYKTQEVSLNGRRLVDVSLDREDITGEEVIITGYTAQSRRDVTGAVVTVKSEDIKAVPTTGVEQALQGRAAGVVVSQQGGPGGAAMVRIRGFGTINDNNPLYIIDGMQATNGLNELNPNDIESVQVLKDASAASIYGARAANGVIVITTKKGSYSAPTITFDAYYGVQSANTNRFPEMLDPQGLADLIWESRRNAGQVGANGNPSHPQYGNGQNPVLPDYIFPAGAFEGDPRVNPANYSNNIDESGVFGVTKFLITRANKQGTDWLDEIFTNAPIQNYQLSSSGGGAGGRYNVSANYFRQDGIILETFFERFSARANSESRVKNWLTVGENLQVSYTLGSASAGTFGEGTAVGNAIRMPQIVPVYDIAGNFAGPKGSGLTNATNSVATLLRGADNRGRRLRLLGNAYAQVEPIKGLLVKSNIGIDYNTFNSTNYGIRTIEAAEPSSANSLSNSFSYFVSWIWTNTVQYKKRIADIHDIDVMAGTEAIENTYREFGASRQRFFSDNVSYRYLSTGTPSTAANYGFGGQSALFSTFGRVNYQLLDRYLITATVRRDGSSKFGENFPFGTFSAVSGGWRLSEENFLSGVSWIDDLKLRVGWGQTGNERIGNDNAWATLYGPDDNTGSYDIAGTNTSAVVGFDQNQAGNPDVRWEATTTTNIGIDLSVLNNRLGFTLDLYDRNTTDMLFQPQRPRTAGQATDPFINIGSMNNKGIDFMMNFRNAPGKDFTYDIALNVSAYRNQVTALSEGATFLESGGTRQGNTARSEVGLPIAQFYGWDIVGIFQTAEEVSAQPHYASIFTNPEDGVGRFHFRDVNGDSALDGDDRIFIGNPHPDFTYGLNVALGYKNFDLTLFIQGVQGNDLYNYNNYFLDFFSFQGNQSVKMAEQSWRAPGDGSTLPKLDPNNGGSNNENNRPSSYFIEDGSYARLKNVQLGYTLPASVLDRIRVNRARIYIQGTNLLTFTNYSGLDPEISVSDFFGQRGDLSIGLDSGIYPVSRSVQVGLSLTL